MTRSSASDGDVAGQAIAEYKTNLTIRLRRSLETIERNSAADISADFRRGFQAAVDHIGVEQP